MARYTIIYIVLALIDDQPTIVYTTDLREDAINMKNLWNANDLACKATVIRSQLYLNKERHTIETDYAMPEYDPDLYT